ncbi:MAG: hypothetical protein ACE5FU_13340 [Nitrospinota bacterium]
MSENINEGLYEGLQMRQKIISPPTQTIPEEKPMSYQQYKFEREEFKKKNPDK